MIFVIQCAGSKRHGAGSLTRGDGSPVMFVAKPAEMPDHHHPEYVYAHPDDISEYGESWRRRLLDYNENPGSNPLGLLPAWQLYLNPAYSRLVETYGPDRVYVLSAGWGLINSEFLTPPYDVTFSAKRGTGMKRDASTHFRDLCLIPEECREPIVFFGGKSYLPLFCELTRPFDCRKIVFYNSSNPPHAPGCELRRFKTQLRTNWHYQCAQQFMDGAIDAGS